MPRKYDLPNANDPLSEPTLNRRLWASYLRAGYNRSSFARALGMNQSLIYEWDTGKRAPTLANFIKACELAGASMDEIAHGPLGENRRRGPETPLSIEEVRQLLLELNATAEQIAALGEHGESSAGRLQPMTRTYVTRFISAYAGFVEAKKSHATAIKLAMVEASNARAMVNALDSKRKPLAASTATRKGRKKPRRVDAEPPTRLPH